MVMYKKLVVKSGDFILKQERGRGLVPIPELTKIARKNPELLFDAETFVEDNIKKGHLEEGVRYFLWSSSRQAYLPIYFDLEINRILIEI